MALDFIDKKKIPLTKINSKHSFEAEIMSYVYETYYFNMKNNYNNIYISIGNMKLKIK